MYKRTVKPTILIVDDEPDNINALTLILAERFHIKAADNGAVALKIAQTRHVDIILLDIIMPVMDGHEVLRGLRGNPQTSNIPVILITASNEAPHEERGLMGGAADYIRRPFDSTVLKLRIDRQLQISAEKTILEGLAGIDHLTQIPNRRQFDAHVDREWRRAQRVKTRLSLAMIDIDCFKDYNDAYGHHAGDEALISIANLIQRRVKRAGDVVGRWGGEEFSILLVGVDRVTGAKIIGEILKDVTDLQMKHSHQPHSQYLSASAGGATWDSSLDLKSPKALMRHADSMLYKAKEQGKNRVLWYQHQGS